MVDDSKPLYAITNGDRVVEISNDKMDLVQKAHHEGMLLWRMVQIYKRRA